MTYVQMITMQNQSIIYCCLIVWTWHTSICLETWAINYTDTGGNGRVVNYCAVLAQVDMMSNKEYNTAINGFIEGDIIAKGEIKA